MVSGEVEGSRNLVLSLKIPFSTPGGASFLLKNSKDIVICLEEEPRPCPAAALLLLDCSSFVSASPPFPDNKHLFKSAELREGQEAE